ncbi:unnamed protein product [Trifolium pratense]|uniref:Uncharacterized protein n=3 Tax=Trifolium pratense TaxID=57577 RepID=A0ACB0M237_TRIPR|nr:unnamed protein product [Trifolium pratense]CAJ2674688.1 unnamed protein product [Trifolium pratense]
MASSTHFNNDIEDAAPPVSPRLSPALVPDHQALPESDPRDGQEVSWTSEDGDLGVLTEKQAGKRPQSEQGKSAETDLSAASVTNAELASLIAALKQTTEALQGQNRRLDEQNTRLDRLERNQRFSRNNSPPRRTPVSQSPPRQEVVKQRRPALERIEQPNKKRDHVSPPREGVSSPVSKKGKTVDRTPPRRHSPQGLSLMTKQAQPVSRNQFSRSPTPDREDSPPLNSHESDEEDPRCPLSHDILQAPVPKGFERPPALPVYDGLTDPDEHIASVNATLNFLRVSGAIRCRIFPTTLRKGGMAWYHSLPPRSIVSWMDLSDQFRRHFTASRKQPKTEAVLDAIFQAENEPLRSFIERFNREAVQVETTDDMKKYLLQRGLRPNSDFAKAVGIEKPRTFSDLLLKSQAYIQYEEQQAADAARYGRAGNNQPAPRSNAEQSSRGGGRPRSERPGRGERPRETRGPPSTFNNYTPLNRTRDEIWKEVNSAEFSKAGIKFPRQQPAKPGQDKTRFCKYHKGYGHYTDDCVQLKDAIEILIRNGQIKQYVKRDRAPRTDAVETSNSEEAAPESSGHKPVALAISRPEDFLIPDHLDDTYIAPTLNKWDTLAQAMVISGGGFDKQTVGSIKRKFEELLDGSSNRSASIDKPKGQSKPISFYMEELPGGAANSQIPLLIRVDMANMDVRRVLVDQGSSCDIMYSQLFNTLQLDETYLTPYFGSDLSGFNGATTKPWGYVDLLVTVGSEETAKTIKVKFLVVDCPSLYQCILGRPAIADLMAVPSTAHLKMKYYTHKGQVATLHGDIEAARRVFNASSKGNEYIGQLPESKKSKAAASLPLPEISSIDLDSRFSKQENKDEKKLRKDKKEDDEASQEHRRPVPDGEFELMPFGEDPSRAIKIGTGLPELARKQLEACLKENADLFAWHASEMPGLDPNVACHQLTIDPTVLPVVQRRRRQSPEKSEAAEKCVKDLLEANFISEARYTTWLSNVVLVKKSNGKWRMCCDYTDLNRACPKDSYPLPSIDRLVDNSSGFKLLSFMDAYSGYNQIPMAVADRTKTAFMTESGNYYYNVMPFGLKNAGATYQRMMNKVFQTQIGDMLEVYMDDMIVKSPEELDHVVHLRKVFEQARKYNMRFNPEKCTFGVRAGKFLGFYLTERGIEANPDKCRAFAELPTPNDKKSIQTLNGMLTSLSRFVSKSAQHALPFFKLLKKEAVFEWTDECEQALQHLKKALSEPPVLSRPSDEEILYLYLSVASEAVSAALIRETNEGQKPVYFTSKALQGPELRYQQIEKIALALVYAARRLRHYFLAHTIVVRTDQPIKSLLGRPDMAGRMLKWSLELSEFDIRYESRKALKAQVLADFVAEMTSSFPTVDGADKWTIFVDGASSATGAGAGIILENENGLLIEVSLALSFPTSNNQAEYEAFLAGLRLAEDLEAKEVKIYTDSQLVASQVLGEYQTKNDNLSEYLLLVKEKITKFNSVEILHVPREHNKRADILSKLASTKRKGGNKSVIQEILPRPSIEKPTKGMDINVIGDKNCWMTPVYNFLKHGTLPDDQKQAAVIRRRACSYVILDGKLYRRGFSIPLLKCADEDTADYILREVHEGINAQHLGGRSLARKALRAGYYWPTMQQDAKDHVKKCDKCQRHGDMHLAPPRELKSLSSPWPFAWWGMDLLGPFTKGLYQNRYLIVAVDYFTKWVEAEPLSDITSFRVLRFFKRNVLARFGIPQVVVTDNGTQFTDKEFQAFLVALGTKQHFTSVEHPQTNGQAEAANRVILRGLRRRLDQNKKKWVEELDNVLWAYRTTPHSTTGETPFRMVYGTEAVIPVEIGEPSRRTEQPLDEEQNDEALREELDLVEEIRTGASLKEATLKQKIAARHDTKVIKREFEVGSLVLRRNADSQDGKLAPNWEGPYRVISKTENGAYYLEDLRGKKLPRPWNAQKLKQYYS